MRILHYSLGFPPYRSGGMTKFCMDLMLSQKEQGYDVALLWPGRMRFKNSKSNILETIEKSGIISFEICNPLPVSLEEGIAQIDIFTLAGDKNFYLKFLNSYSPNVIHMHTFMGIHKAFLEAAKELEIRIVFTTHDFFSICPKVILFNKGQVCDGNYRKCIGCNIYALPLWKIRILQSPKYRKTKNSKIIKKLRALHKIKFYENGLKKGSNEELYGSKNSEKYLYLRNYYYEMLSMVDCIHFNSQLTYSIYEKRIKINNYVIIPIIHKEIKNHCRIKTFSNILHISFLAQPRSEKGYYLLIEVLDELWQKGIRNFELNLYYPIKKSKPYMRIYERYQYEQLEEIYNQADLVVVPSVCYETYGYIVPEALSYGVPVIVSNHVGAKDLILDKQYVFPAGNKKALYEILSGMNQNKLRAYNKRLCDEMVFDDMQGLCKKMEEIYQK